MYNLNHCKVFNIKLGITFIFPLRITGHRRRALSSILKNPRKQGNYACTFAIFIFFFSANFPFYFIIFSVRLNHLVKFTYLIKFKP